MIKNSIRSFVTVLSTRGLILIVGFLKSVVLAKGLGVDGQGQYAIAVTIYTTFFQIFCMGLHSAQNYYLARDRRKLSVIWGNTIGISTICGAMCILCSVIMMFFDRGTSSLVKIIYTSILIVPVYLYFYLQQQILFILDQVQKMNRLEIIVTLLPLFIYIFLGEVNLLSVKLVIIVTIFVYFLADIIGCMTLVKMHTRISFSVSFYLKCLKTSCNQFFCVSSS